MNAIDAIKIGDVRFAGRLRDAPAVDQAASGRERTHFDSSSIGHALAGTPAPATVLSVQSGYQDRPATIRQAAAGT